MSLKLAALAIAEGRRSDKHLANVQKPDETRGCCDDFARLAVPRSPANS
jgi:hypothetical protein